MTTVRLPKWLRDEVGKRSDALQVEHWVALMDLLARAQRVEPPEYPLAVRRRYGSELTSDGRVKQP